MLDRRLSTAHAARRLIDYTYLDAGFAGKVDDIGGRISPTGA